MLRSRIKEQMRILLFGSFIVALTTLACGGEGVTDLIEPIAMPSPTSEPTLETINPNYVMSLPEEVKSASGRTFTIMRVELLEAINAPIGSRNPKRGLYLLLVGTISNANKTRECVRGQEFVLSDGAERYGMWVEDAEAVYHLYNLPYPDFFMGYCLDAGQTADTFLVFDVSREAGDLWLEFGNSKSQLGRMAALIKATPQPVMPALKPEVQPTSLTAGMPKPFVTALDRNVNIRSGPGTQYQIVGSLLTGQSLEIVGRTADNSWWQVAMPGGLGWVAAKVTSASNVSESIPVH